MKKLIFTSALAIAAVFSTATYASGGYWDHDGWEGHHGHHHHHHEHHHWRPQYREVIRYYPPRPQYREVINYYPAPPRPRPIYREQYYQQPQPQSYYYQDGRNTSGLAGGVVGGVMGYQFGNGDPLATGIGAAAGAMIGNGFDGR